MDSNSDRRDGTCCGLTTALVPPPSEEEEDITPEELEEFTANCWRPEEHDCLWALQCDVGDKFPVMVDTRPEYELWCIGTVVSVDLVSQAVKFTFPGLCHLSNL